MTERAQRLIFDIGMHHGQDTAYYLSLGNRVVAVDADPTLIDRARESRRAAYIYVNNRLEGNAPSTIMAIVDQAR